MEQTYVYLPNKVHKRSLIYYNKNKKGKPEVKSPIYYLGRPLRNSGA